MSASGREFSRTMAVKHHVTKYYDKRKVGGSFAIHRLTQMLDDVKQPKKAPRRRQRWVETHWWSG